MTMTLAVTDVGIIPIDHDEAMALAESEFARALYLLRALGHKGWHQQTVCEFVVDGQCNLYVADSGNHQVDRHVVIEVAAARRGYDRRER
jgi:hypothetical protein